jgi:hypothetical protein
MPPVARYRSGDRGAQTQLRENDASTIARVFLAARRRERAGAIRCKARRHRWHFWHSRQCGICKLQNLKEPPEFESHSLRQL